MPTHWQYANEWEASERRVNARLKYGRQRKVGEEEVSGVWMAAGAEARLAGGDSAPLLWLIAPPSFPDSNPLHMLNREKQE